jgi:ABC-type phosphate transport system substrate-binding protein
MSAHTAKPGPQPRRTIHPVIWSAAAIILLTLAACTSTSSTGTPASAAVAANTGPPGHRPTITGAGSTFDAPFFSVAFARYQQ